jgi:YVTN family beta-propeller protein
MSNKKSNQLKQINMNTNIRKITAALLASMLFFSCSKEPNPEEGVYGPGIYVCNEGNFNQSNASISYIPRTNYQVYNDIFAQANNNATLGDVAQSISLHNGKFYIVLNNSGKVTVVNAEDFKISGTISDRNLPRYMAFKGDRGYLTEWQSFTSNGKLTVINLINNSVVKQIDVGKFPEKLIIHNNRLFVTNSNDTTISVINLNTETLEQTLTVGHWPNSIVKDANNKLWVLCGGIPSWAGGPTPGTLVRINPDNLQIEQTLSFNSTSSNPSNLSINKAGNKLYYVFENKIYQTDITASSIPASPLISSNFTYTYGLGIDPQSNYIFVADAGSFTSNGVVRWYSSTGSLIDTAVVGIGPNGFYFWE